MMTLDAGQIALLESDAVGIVYLIELDFLPTTIYLTTFNVDLPIVGRGDYTAAGSLLSVGEIKESQDTDTQTLPITLNVADSALLALALGNVENYRGKKARIYLQPLDASYRPVGEPRLRFSGEMEPVKIHRDTQPDEGGPVGGTIELPISRAGMSRARNADGLRLTDEQQQAEYPGDLGLQYVRALIEQPSQWLSTRFQQQ
ncbi:MAG: hypothetical protein IV107_24165 [Paucibacter sp.]|nr:hypothetical protein [Roseateles sp.]